MEAQIKAKRAILEESLRVVTDPKQMENCRKRRQYIKETLNCELSIPITENQIFSIDFIDSSRFERHVITRFEVKNRLETDILSIQASIGIPNTLIRWTLFENSHSPNILQSIRPNSTVVVCLAIPFSAFLASDTVNLIFTGNLVPSKRLLLHPTAYPVIGANLRVEPYPEADFSVRIDFSEAIEELDVKSIEFVDESKSTRIIQSLLTVLHRFPVPIVPDFATFRREFPHFSANDFDTWRLFVGADNFDGLFLFTESSDDVTRCHVISENSSICEMFLRLLNEKCQ